MQVENTKFVAVNYTLTINGKCVVYRNKFCIFYLHSFIIV